MSGLKKKFKNILHKSDFKFFDKILKKRNLIKSFPRYNIINSENSVLGWVPYFKNKTKISVFNFFSINYAIRKKLNGNIFLIKDLIVIDQLKFTFIMIFMTLH